MYKTASDRRQAALHRGKPWDWAGGDLRQSHEDELDAVRRAIRAIEADIAGGCLSEAQRKEIGRRKLALQTRASELKVIVGLERRCAEGIGQFFLDVAKERMLPGEFSRALEEARRRQETELSALTSATEALDSAGQPTP